MQCSLCFLCRYSRDATHHSIVYRRSDIQWEALQGARCGLSDSSLVGYLHRTQRSTPGEGGALGEGVTVGERGRVRRQDRDLVRCDLSVTGDYKFYEAVTGEGSVEERRSVAASLLVSYVQGASRIFQVHSSL